ncbi:MAG: COG3650 family protein [Novosphingobium sp.]
MVKFAHLLIAASLVTLLSGCSPDPVEAPTGSASEAVAPVPVVTGAVTSPSLDMSITDKAKVVPDTFRAIGTEPFWSAEVEGAKLRWSTPEQPDSVAMLVTRKDRAGGAILKAMIDGQVLELEITSGPCSDGMSDTVYPWSVTRRLGGDTQRGCAR